MGAGFVKMTENEMNRREIRGLGDSNQNTLCRCMKLSKNKFNQEKVIFFNKKCIFSISSILIGLSY